MTMSAPTCEACIPIALDLCPALGSVDLTMARVLEWTRVGVFGSALVRDEEGEVQLQQHVLVR